ncbi:MAG: prepilin peptidase, partial [Candidatus Omnitrophica bacterium CG_4_9_14_0_2_um_filter_43_12]
MIAIVFIFGAMVGSFLNVCIYRMPKGRSVIKPASHCPRCDRHIQWFDNIPILSFVMLGAKCRHCKKKISLRYPLVELLTAVLFIVNFIWFGTSPKFFIYTALECALVIGTFTDFAYYMIPDEITIGGLAAGLIVSAIYPELHNAPVFWKGF